MPTDSLLSNTRSALSPDSKLATDADRISALNSLFYIARDQKRNLYQNWSRNYKIIKNRLQGSNLASWLPQPRDSEVYPVVSSLVAWLTDQDPDIGFLPSADPNSQYYESTQRLAADLDNVYQTVWLNEEYDAEIKKMLWDALTFGLGTLKVVWDNAAAGGYGDAVWRRIDPWMLYHDPYAANYRDMEFIIEARRVSGNELERMYPDTYDLLRYHSSSSDGIDERPQFNDDNAYPKAPFLGGLPSGAATVWNAKVSGGRMYDPLPGFITREFWLKENDHSANEGYPGLNAYARPRWRCIVVCNNIILFNEWAEDLWQHGQHPYEDYRFDDVGEMYGIALLDHLAYPQIYINRLLTALQQNAELVGNPIFLEPTNSGLSRIGIINRPGQRLPVNAAQAAGTNLPRWLEPPSMPPSVQNLVDFWIARIENTAGLGALQKGQAPNQRNAEGVINNIQEAAFVRVRSALANLQWTYRRASLKAADLIVENYTEPRLIAIVGEDGNKDALSLTGRHFYNPGDNQTSPLRFVLRVEAGTNQPTSPQARMANAEKLAALGLVDDEYVLHVHKIKDAKQILQRLYMKRQQGLIGGGGGTRQRQGRSR
jgi:hypothetical protein